MRSKQDKTQQLGESEQTTSDTLPAFSIEEFSKTRQNFKPATKKLSNSILALTKKINPLEAQIKKLQEKKSSTGLNEKEQQRLKDLQEQLEPLQSQLTAAQTNLRDKFKELRDKTKTLDTKIQELEKKEQELKQQMEETKHKKAELKKQDKHSEDYHNTKKTLKTLTDEHSQTANKLKELKDKAKEAQKLLHSNGHSSAQDTQESDPSEQENIASTSASTSFSEVVDPNIQSLPSTETEDHSESASQSSHEPQHEVSLVIAPRVPQQNDTVTMRDYEEPVLLPPVNLEPHSPIAIITNGCGGGSLSLINPLQKPPRLNQDGDPHNDRPNDPLPNPDSEQGATQNTQGDTTANKMPIWKMGLLMTAPGALIVGAAVSLKNYFGNDKQNKTSDEQNTNMDISDIIEESNTLNGDPINFAGFMRTHKVSTNQKSTEAHLAQEPPKAEALTSSDNIPVSTEENEVHLEAPTTHTDEVLTSSDHTPVEESYHNLYLNPSAHIDEVLASTESIPTETTSNVVHLEAPVHIDEALTPTENVKADIPESDKVTLIASGTPPEEPTI